ncbi:MAG: exodeoxyribonuclease 7 large subunit [Saprospiraceae bacterium]|nr:MAG: exodeoxyribonuclease 7 large subunit [Saprospiraceae bacterium]
MQSFSLFELNEYLRRIIALNIPSAIWVKAEIAQLANSRGHLYLELVQKGEEEQEILAQSSAIIWENTYRSLRRKIGKDLDALLQEGMEVQFKATVKFHERYGLKLFIEEIDPVFTLGKLALQKQDILAKLQELDLLEVNKQIPLPPVLQNLAVISSLTAAGYQDFLQQLSENPYGYQFRCRLFPTAMQGQEVEKEVLRKLKAIRLRQVDFDAVVIIRGGGSRLDLAAFDSFELSKAIARCPLPVLTGIGHDIDESVLDKVAHQSLKTPTAVADFIIQSALTFESQLTELGLRFESLARAQLHSAQLRIEIQQQQIFQNCREQFNSQTFQLKLLNSQLKQAVKLGIKENRNELSQLEQMVNLLQVETQLKRGYSLTLKGEKIVKSVNDVQVGDQLKTLLADGNIQSEVLPNETE